MKTKTKSGAAILLAAGFLFLAPACSNQDEFLPIATLPEPNLPEGASDHFNTFPMPALGDSTVRPLDEEPQTPDDETGL